MKIINMRLRVFFVVGLLSLFFTGLSLLATRSGTAQGRIVRVVNTTASAGSSATVSVELVAQGNEAAVGFSLTFNPAILSNPQTTLGTGAAGAALNANLNQVAQGRLGIVLALPSGQAFPAGTRQLVSINFAVAGNAPAGATPIGFGNQPVAQEVADVGANEQAATFTGGTVTVQAACPAITISPATLGGGQIGQPYSQQLTQIGGTAPITWSLTGNLPNNVTLNASTGLISGTPTASGTYPITVTATAANGCTGTKSYSLVISPCPVVTITPGSLQPGTVGTLFSQSLTPNGGTPPYTFSFDAGSTPPSGLTLSANGLLSGTPTSAGSFPFTVKVTDTNGCTGTQSYTLAINPVITSNGLQFYPLAKPLRLLDTRPANQLPSPAFDTPGTKIKGLLTGGVDRVQQAQVTFDGMTIPANAKAIVGTATVINFPGAGEYDGTGNVTFYPADAIRPEVSNLNYAANQTISNGFTVALSNAGAFSIFSYSDVHLVVEIVGYYAAPTAAGLYFHPLPKPIRLLETRPQLFYTGCSTPRAQLASGSVRTEQGRLTCGGVTIPAAAQALVGNLTAVNATANGFATAFAGDLAVTPTATSLAYTPVQPIANAFVTRLGNDGSFKLFVSNTTDFLVDISGYYSTEANDVNGQGLLFTQLARPIRLLETRAGFPGCYMTSAPLAAQSNRVQPAWGGCDGVTIPTNALAIIGNVTAVTTTPATVISFGSGNVTLYPGDSNQPDVSNLNYIVNQNIPNAFIVRLNTNDGKFSIFVFDTIDLLIDVSGYFAP